MSCELDFNKKNVRVANQKCELKIKVQEGGPRT